jgi:hypothetical protein
MPAHFSNMLLRYVHSQAGLDDLDILLNLSSLNFDINHTTIGPDTPFTSEMTFDVAIESEDDADFENMQQLAALIDAHFPNSPVSPLDPANKVARLLQGFTVGSGSTATEEGVFIDDNLELQYFDVNVPTRIITESSFHHVLAAPINLGESDLFSARWAVKMKFHVAAPVQSGGSNGGTIPLATSVVVFPVLRLDGSGDVGSEQNSLAAANDVLRLNYELTYLPETGSTAPMASPIGKVADELTDSIANLTSTLAANLTSTFKTQLQPAGAFFSNDIALWLLIKKGTDELAFGKYFDYMETVFCGKKNYAAGHIVDKAEDLDRRRSTPFMNVDAYRAVKIATEAFVMVNCMTRRGFTETDIEDLRTRVHLIDGVPNETELANFFDEYRVRVNGGRAMIPYLAVIRRKLSNEAIKFTPFEEAFDFFLSGNTSSVDTCYGVISDKLTHPCFLELIWSYWHEESMMVQGLNAVGRRFQNIRGTGAVDPLANLEIDPLRPLNNLMWGYIQDEQHRLTVMRRAYEYDHHYGVSLKGEATKNLRFADSRSKFIEAFHTLLNLASRFYKQSDDMTVKPDGFPLLNGLKETHLVLSEGAHNQFGDLPSTARAEMLIQQWLLARPEFREFLPTRIMVAYPEAWMDRTSALNNLMGWTKSSVLHFNYLAVYGEKILLSIRFGNWADPAIRSDAAANWAIFWRQEIQGYIHAYRAVTGVDLSADGVMAGQKVDADQPSVHLLRRLAEQQNGQARVSANGNGKMKSVTTSKA